MLVAFPPATSFSITPVPNLRAISLVKTLPYDSDRGALPNDWGTAGWRSDLAYYELTKLISIDQLGPKLRDLKLSKSPIDRNGGVNQGYLFALNEMATQVILREIGRRKHSCCHPGSFGQR
jgi:hypothetical protein